MTARAVVAIFMMVYNDGDVTVLVRISPPLEATAGDHVVLLLDSHAAASGRKTRFELKGVDVARLAALSKPTGRYEAMNSGRTPSAARCSRAAR